MASKINPATPSDSTQRIASKTRLGVSAALGAAATLGALGAAVYFKDASFMKKEILGTICSFAKEVFSNVENKALVGAGAGVIGGILGKLTAAKVSLNDVKGKLGVAGSDLSFSQMHRVANIAATTVQAKDDAARIKNLNKELTNTELSLASDAHSTSKARSLEARLFDFEGAKLANVPASPEEFVEMMDSLEMAINAEVKATDMYTKQIGNSKTSGSRREYIFAGIMDAAHARGIAGNYLTAAVQERAETAKSNPKLADANFRQALEEGIETGILDPKVDPKCYQGMVDAAAAASQISSGKNPDSAISSVFDALKGAGLIDKSLRATFIKDVRATLGDENADISNPIEQKDGRTWSQWFKQLKLPKLPKREPQEAPIDAPAVDTPAVETDAEIDAPVVETAAQKRARLAEERARTAEEKARAATEEVTEYSSNLESLDSQQKKLAGLYETLIALLNEKRIPLDQVMGMDKSKLAGALVMTHQQGFDLFAKYEANDAAIAQAREEIAALREQIGNARVQKPKNFKFASKDAKNAARVLERQVQVEGARIKGLKRTAAEASSKIQEACSQLWKNESKTNAYLFSKEEAIAEPILPKEKGFFGKLFSGKKAEESLTVEETVDAPVAAAVEETIDAPATAKAPSFFGKLFSKKKEETAPIAAPVDETSVEEAALPEPVVAKKQWKLWG